MARVNDAVAAVLIALVAGSALCQDEGTTPLSNENQEYQNKIMERLRSNILLYNKVYFDWNRRHLFGDTSSLWEIEGKKDEVSRQLLKLRGGDRVAAGLKMKIDDIPQNDDLLTDIVSENKNDEEKGAALKRILSEGYHNNDVFESVSINDRKKREATKVGQKTQSASLNNDGEFANEEEREGARRIGPMKVPQLSNFEERGIGYPGPRPLRMILTETIDDEIERANEEEREGAHRIGPMKVPQFSDFEERGTGYPGPRPLRMILTETIDDEIERADEEEKEGARRIGPMKVPQLSIFEERGTGYPGPRPLRMILTETIDDEIERANEEEREGARRIGPMKVPQFSDFEERGTGYPGPRPLRMILTETIDDEIERANEEEREGARRIGPMKVPQFGDFEDRGTGYPGPRPLRMILTETIDDEIERAKEEEREGARRIGPMKVPQFGEFEERGTGYPGPRPLRMILTETIDDEIERANEEEREGARRIGPMKVPQFSDFEERGTGWPGPSRPLRMILTETIDDDIVNANKEERQTIDRTGPLRMIIADGKSHLDEFAEFEIRGSSGPRPLRMILNDNFEDDIDTANVEGRNAPNRIAPLRMIIADATHDDAELTEMERYESGYPGPRPLRMFVSDITANKREDADINTRKGDKIRPLKSIPPTNKYFNEDIQLRKAAGPIGPMKMVPSLEEYNNKAETTDLDSDIKRRLVRWKRETEGRPLSENNLDDLKIVRDKKDTFSMSFGGDQKQNREDQRFYWSKHDKEQCAKEAALIYEWLEACLVLVKDIPDSHIDLFENWGNIIQLFNNDTRLRLKFASLFPAMYVRDAIEIMSIHEAFLKLFWPFRYKIGFLNQKLGLLGFSGKEVSMEEQKLAFYEALEKYQNIKITTAADSVTYSFNDSEIVDGLNRSGLVEFSKEFIEAGRHLAAEEERPEMIRKVSEAMKLIEERTPEIYRAISQLVGTFAFYKAEQPGYIGGTVSSALGIIWLDPGATRNLSIPFFAEQIVHEFIHTSLFYAELVHGTYTDHANLPNAKVVSSIRRQLRDYDKSFHAAYVSTGLVAFHARAGFLNRAENLAKPLLTTVDDLIVVNNRTGILNESGLAMLQALVDFLTATRLKK